MKFHADPGEMAEQVGHLLATASTPAAALQQQALLCLQCGYPDQAEGIERSGRLDPEQLAVLQALIHGRGALSITHPRA